MSSILIIEDDTDLAELMAITLRTVGHEIRHAPDGRTALAALQVTRPDLVLLDIMLPDIVGFSLCEALRRLTPTAHLPILVVSACDEAEARPLAIASGANGFLAKPFLPRQLLARVRSLLGRSSPRPA
jgi:DNA-binding response OmpR family regulator